MELDPTGYYRMPLIMGPLWRGEKPRIKYTHTEVIALHFRGSAVLRYDLSRRLV
jgi:hypothetical protein